MTDTNTKPFVGAALICEKILTEKDGVVTPVRIVDTFYVKAPSATVSANITRGIKAVGYICLKSGAVTGKHTVGLTLRSPSDTVTRVAELPVVMEGGVQGVTMQVDVTLAAKELGYYRIDVSWDTEPLTSIPFRLVEGVKPAEPETK